MPDISILDPAVHAAPKSYLIKGAQEIVLKGVTGSYDGTSAAGSWVPAVQVVDPSGFVVGTYPLGETLAAGASADVSWFPGVATTQSTPPVGQVRLIYDYTITGAAKTSIDTGVDGTMAAPFPTDLNYLEAFLSGRTDEARLVSDVSVWFNNDTTDTDYARIAISSSTGGTPGQVQVLSGETTAGVLAGANSAAHVPGLMRLFMPNYNGTTNYKVCEFTAWADDPTAGLTHYQISLESFLWKNTAALSRLMFTPFTGGSKLDVGTRLTVWAR